MGVSVRDITSMMRGAATVGADALSTTTADGPAAVTGETAFT